MRFVHYRLRPDPRRIHAFSWPVYSSQVAPQRCLLCLTDGTKIHLSFYFSKLISKKFAIFDKQILGLLL